MSRAAALALLGVALLSVNAAVLAADRGTPDVFRVTAGIGGLRRTGAWTPIVVSSTSGAVQPGDSLHVSVEDPDGQFVRSPPAVATDAGEGRTTARFSVRFGRPSGRVRVEREHPGGAGTLVEEHRLGEPIPATEGVVVIYGDLPAAARAVRLIDRERGTQTRVITIDPRLGDGDGELTKGASARDYDAADAVFICGDALGRLPAGAIAGIDAWVMDGGRLVFICGASAAEVAAADAAKAPAAWLPGEFDRMVPLRRLGAIEAYARAAGLVDRVPATGLPMPVFSGRAAGVVELAAMNGGAGLPVVVRRGRGLGTVTWLGIDCDTAALRNWPGWDTLIVALLGGRTQSGGERSAVETAAAPDLAGQLRAALDTFSTADGSRPARPVPFEMIAGLGLLYVLCLYPFDWWLVSRDGGRPWLSWLTLPAFAAAFTAAAWGMTTWWGGGRAAAARTAGVVDIDAESRRIRGRGWAAMLAAANDRLDVAADEAMGLGRTATSDDAAVSWCAAAGRGFGGLDAAVPHPSLAAADYGYRSSLAVLDGVPVAVASSRVFEAGWTAEAESPVVTSTLFKNPQGTLGGGVAHHLPFPLEHCRLLHAGWLYDLGTLHPGDRYDTDAGRGPRSLASALARRAAVKERDATVRWDPSSTDVGRILEVAGFHAAVGGTGYTGLEAGGLGRLDMSPLLSVDRAVLVGFAPAGHEATTWRLALRGATADPASLPAAATLCRIVIPLAVEPTP
jgi:hypothetical protein